MRLIKLDDKKTLKPLILSKELLLNSVILIYGARNTGKTTAIFDIMYKLRNSVNEAYVISLSAGANNQFKDYIPDKCILTELAPDFLLKLVKRQKAMAARLRAYANNSEIRMKLFERCANSSQKILMENIIKKSQDHLEKAEKDYHDDIEYLQAIQMDIRKNRDKFKNELMINTITNNLNLLKNAQLSKEEKIAVSDFNVNPHILLIFDDCAVAMKEWTKKCPELIESIYNGRHYFMTVIITAQVDTAIDNRIRSNATVSFFTDENTATTNLSREHKGDKSRANTCIKALWRSNSKVTYKKLAFLSAPEDQDPFRYIVFMIHDKFRVGSSSFWEKIQIP